MFENSAARCRIGDRHRSCGGIEVTMTLEVHDKVRVCVEVGQPVPLTRCPRDEETAADIEHPDLNAARQPGEPSGGRDVHGRIVSEFDAHDIHHASVRPPKVLHARGAGYRARMRLMGAYVHRALAVVLLRALCTVFVDPGARSDRPDGWRSLCRANKRDGDTWLAGQTWRHGPT